MHSHHKLKSLSGYWADTPFFRTKSKEGLGFGGPSKVGVAIFYKVGTPGQTATCNTDLVKYFYSFGIENIKIWRGGPYHLRPSAAKSCPTPPKFSKKSMDPLHFLKQIFEITA